MDKCSPKRKPTTKARTLPFLFRVFVVKLFGTFTKLELLRTLPCYLVRQLIQCPKAKRVGRAGCHTGGFFSPLNTIHAQVALLHLSITAVLRGAKGTHDGAQMTPEAFLSIHNHYSIFKPFLDGTPRAHCHTGWIPAVHTGHRNGSVCHTWKVTLPHADNSPPVHAPFRIM
jgi:hypothetical protein